MTNLDELSDHGERPGVLRWLGYVWGAGDGQQDRHDERRHLQQRPGDVPQHARSLAVVAELV
jgi:hypothetical protein